jgi:peptide/nickel transport system substrate-binding protein
MVVACESKLSDSLDVSKEGNNSIIVVALAQAPTSLDPADHRDPNSETVIRNIFDGLVTRDTRSGIHLELAEELNWLDEKTLEIKLRKGVKFHNGTEMTADDVVYTFNRIIQKDMIDYPEPHTSPRKGLIAPLKAIEKTNDYTAVMYFSDPWPAAMQMLVHQQIVPKAYIEEMGTEGFVKHPIGTGPFMFVSATTGLEVVNLKRFDEYFGGAPNLEPVGPACVEGVVFRVIPEVSTRITALLVNDVQIIQHVPSDLINMIAANPNLQVKTAPGTQPKWLELNVNHPLFSALSVRQALNYAIDKDLIVQKIYNGHAIPLPGPLSPFNKYVNTSLDPYPYDPEKARTLLQVAGWVDTDNDGILDNKGRPFTFTIDTLTEWRPLADAISIMLKDIQIGVNTQIWEYSVIKQQLHAGKRVAYLDDWGDSAFDPTGHFEAKWHGYIIESPYGRGNFSNYNNDRVNELIRLGEITSDTVRRQEIYDEAQQIIYNEVPAVFLILSEEIYATSVNVRNWEPASDNRINLHDACIVN